MEPWLGESPRADGARARAEAGPSASGRRRAQTSSALLLATLIAGISLWSLWGYASSRTAVGLDFYQFWVVAQAVRQMDVEDIYAESDRRIVALEFWDRAFGPHGSERQRAVASIRVLRDTSGASIADPSTRRPIPHLETYSSPFLYTVLAVFAWGNYERDYLLYTGAAIVLTAASILVFARMVGCSLVTGLLLTTALLAYSDAFLADLLVANVNWIQVVLLTLFLWIQNQHDWPAHHFVGGLVLGATVLFKPNVALIVPMLMLVWLIDRRYRKAVFGLAGVAAGALTAVVASALYFGSVEPWFAWIRSVRSLLDIPIPLEAGNYSLTALLRANGGGEWNQLPLMIAAAILAVVLLVVWIGRRRGILPPPTDPADRGLAFRSDVTMVGIGCATALLAADLAWKHYFVLLIPLIVFCFRPMGTAAAHRPHRVLRELLAIAAVAAQSSSISRVALGETDHTVQAVAVGGATLVFVGLALWDRLRPIETELADPRYGNAETDSQGGHAP